MSAVPGKLQGPIRKSRMSGKVVKSDNVLSELFAFIDLTTFAARPCKVVKSDNVLSDLFALIDLTTFTEEYFNF